MIPRLKVLTEDFSFPSMALHQALYKALTRPILIRLKTESDTHIAKSGGGGHRGAREGEESQ